MTRDKQREAEVQRVQDLLRGDSKLSQRKACEQVGIRESTYRAVRDRIGADKLRAAEANAAGTEEHEDGSITYTTQPWDADSPAPWKVDDVIRAHGDDPADLVVVRKRYNRWGSPEAPMHQLRFDAIPKADLENLFVDMRDWEPPKFEGSIYGPDEAQPFVLRGDQHCPYHDAGLHNAALQHDRDHKPGLVVFIGDGINSERAGRHRPRRGVGRPTKEGIKAYGHILADTRHANPHARMVVLRGNHDDWVEQRLLEQNPDLADLETAFTDIPMHSLRHLLHLDDMDIELVDEDWNRGKFAVTPALTARHGYLAGKNSGDKMLQKISRSTAYGHTHRLGFTYVTYHDDPDHDTVTRVAINTGTMAQIKDSLWYGDEENWQQGYVTGHAWPDGDFSAAPNVYVHGRLLTADGHRYTPEV